MFVVILVATCASYNITVTPWCDNSFRVQIQKAESAGPAHERRYDALRTVLKEQALDELPSALVRDCVGSGLSRGKRLAASEATHTTHGNLQVSILADGSLKFNAADSGKTYFTAVPVLTPTPTPSAVWYVPNGAVVPSTQRCSPEEYACVSDWILSEGADLVDSRKRGASDIRSGEPHATSTALNAHPINGKGHLLSGVSLSFRYVAGYTPKEGASQASVVTMSLVDAVDGTTVASLWTSPPLGNWSFDVYEGYSPPVTAHVTGLQIACANSLRLALTFTNNERNLQILLPSISVHVRWSDAMQPGPFSPTDLSDGFLMANLRLVAGDVHERVFGLGQGNWTDEGGCPSGEQRVVPLLRNGQRVNLQQRKFHVSIPFAYSSAGYGVLFNMPGYGMVEVGGLGEGGMHWQAAATVLGLDFWVSGLPAAAAPARDGQRTGRQTSPSAVAAPIYHQYADATGHAPPLRENAMLFWQSRNRYKSSAIAMRVVDRYAALKLPVGVLVIDYKNQVDDAVALSQLPRPFIPFHTPLPHTPSTHPFHIALPHSPSTQPFH